MANREKEKVPVDFSYLGTPAILFAAGKVQRELYGLRSTQFPIHLTNLFKDEGNNMTKLFLLLAIFGNQLYAQRNDPNADLLTAADQCDVDGVKKALLAGADVKTVDSKGNTALMLGNACWFPMVDLLVSAGSDVNAENAEGDTALSLAADHPKYLDVVERLLVAGANPNRQTPRACMTIVINNIWYHGGDKVSLFLKYGANPNYAEECELMTPLYVAAAFGRAKVVVDLVNAGALVTATTEEKGTALHGLAGRAYTAEQIKALELLVAKGADVNAQTSFGNTPLYNAAGNHKPESVKALLRLGADPTIPDEKGLTPAAYAESRKYLCQGAAAEKECLEEFEAVIKALKKAGGK